MVVDQPKAAKRLKAEFTSTDRFYARAVALSVLLEAAGHGAAWRQRLVALLGRYPIVRPASMGFPADWQSRTLWT